jgi:sec-independent protein translocase protein TatA
MGTMSVGHWLVVLIVVALLFGPKRLAGLGQGLGEGLRGLKDGLAGRGEDDAANSARSATSEAQRRS